MTDERMVRIGRVGRSHGNRGAFRVADPTERLDLLAPGRQVTVAGLGQAVVAERRGTSERPIVRLESIPWSEAKGRELLVPRRELGELGASEWLIDDMIGCRVEGVGVVTNVVLGPSVDVLQVAGPAGEILVPLNRDAVREVDLGARRIEVDLAFLGLGERLEDRA